MTGHLRDENKVHRFRGSEVQRLLLWVAEGKARSSRLKAERYRIITGRHTGRGIGHRALCKAWRFESKAAEKLVSLLQRLC